jgi:hypothetical protein
LRQSRTARLHDTRIRLIGLHGEKIGALHQRVDLIIGLLTLRPFGRDLRALGRGLRGGRGSELIELRLQSLEPRGQVLECRLDFSADRLGLFLQLAQIGWRKVRLLQRRVDLLQGGGGIVEAAGLGVIRRRLRSRRGET